MCFCDYGTVNSTLRKMLKSGDMRCPVHVSRMRQNFFPNIGDKHATLTRKVGILLLSDATSGEENNR